MLSSANRTTRQNNRKYLLVAKSSKLFSQEMLIIKNNEEIYEIAQKVERTRSGDQIRQESFYILVL